MHFGTRGDDTLLEARWKIVHGTYEFSETLQESSVSGPVGVTTAGASPSCCCLSSGTSSASTSGNRATDAATRRCFMQFSSRGSSSGCHGAHRARLGRPLENRWESAGDDVLASRRLSAESSPDWARREGFEEDLASGGDFEGSEGVLHHDATLQGSFSKEVRAVVRGLNAITPRERIPDWTVSTARKEARRRSKDALVTEREQTLQERREFVQLLLQLLPVERQLLLEDSKLQAEARRAFSGNGSESRRRGVPGVAADGRVSTAGPSLRASSEGERGSPMSSWPPADARRLSPPPPSRGSLSRPSSAECHSRSSHSPRPHCSCCSLLASPSLAQRPLENTSLEGADRRNPSPRALTTATRERSSLLQREMHLRKELASRLKVLDEARRLSSAAGISHHQTPLPRRNSRESSLFAPTIATGEFTQASSEAASRSRVHSLYLAHLSEVLAAKRARGPTDAGVQKVEKTPEQREKEAEIQAQQRTASSKTNSTLSAVNKGSRSQEDMAEIERSDSAFLVETALRLAEESILTERTARPSEGATAEAFFSEEETSAPKTARQTLLAKTQTTLHRRESDSRGVCTPQTCPPGPAAAAPSAAPRAKTLREVRSERRGNETRRRLIATRVSGSESALSMRLGREGRGNLYPPRRPQMTSQVQTGASFEEWIAERRESPSPSLGSHQQLPSESASASTRFFSPEDDAPSEERVSSFVSPTKSSASDDSTSCATRKISAPTWSSPAQKGSSSSVRRRTSQPPAAAPVRSSGSCALRSVSCQRPPPSRVSLALVVKRPPDEGKSRQEVRSVSMKKQKTTAPALLGRERATTAVARESEEARTLRLIQRHFQPQPPQQQSQRDQQELFSAASSRRAPSPPLRFYSGRSLPPHCEFDASRRQHPVEAVSATTITTTTWGGVWPAGRVSGRSSSPDARQQNAAEEPPSSDAVGKDLRFSGGALLQSLPLAETPDCLPRAAPPRKTFARQGDSSSSLAAPLTSRLKTQTAISSFQELSEPSVKRAATIGVARDSLKTERGGDQAALSTTAPSATRRGNSLPRQEGEFGASHAKAEQPLGRDFPVDARDRRGNTGSDGEGARGQSFTKEDRNNSCASQSLGDSQEPEPDGGQRPSCAPSRRREASRPRPLSSGKTLCFFSCGGGSRVQLSRRSNTMATDTRGSLSKNAEGAQCRQSSQPLKEQNALRQSHFLSEKQTEDALCRETQKKRTRDGDCLAPVKSKVSSCVALPSTEEVRRSSRDSSSSMLSSFSKSALRSKPVEGLYQSSDAFSEANADRSDRGVPPETAAQTKGWSLEPSRAHPKVLREESERPESSQGADKPSALQPRQRPVLSLQQTSLRRAVTAQHGGGEKTAAAPPGRLPSSSRSPNERGVSKTTWAKAASALGPEERKTTTRAFTAGGTGVGALRPVSERSFQRGSEGRFQKGSEKSLSSLGAQPSERVVSSRGASLRESGGQRAQALLPKDNLRGLSNGSLTLSAQTAEAAVNEARVCEPRRNCQTENLPDAASTLSLGNREGSLPLKRKESGTGAVFETNQKQVPLAVEEGGLGHLGVSEEVCSSATAFSALKETLEAVVPSEPPQSPLDSSSQQKVVLGKKERRTNSRDKERSEALAEPANASSAEPEEALRASSLCLDTPYPSVAARSVLRQRQRLQQRRSASQGLSAASPSPSADKRRLVRRTYAGQPTEATQSAQEYPDAPSRGFSVHSLFALLKRLTLTAGCETAGRPDQETPQTEGGVSRSEASPGARRSLAKFRKSLRGASQPATPLRTRPNRFSLRQPSEGKPNRQQRLRRRTAQPRQDLESEEALTRRSGGRGPSPSAHRKTAAVFTEASRETHAEKTASEKRHAASATTRESAASGAVRVPSEEERSHASPSTAPLAEASRRFVPNEGEASASSATGPFGVASSERTSTWARGESPSSPLAEFAVRQLQTMGVARQLSEGEVPAEWTEGSAAASFSVARGSGAKGDALLLHLSPLRSLREQAEFSAGSAPSASASIFPALRHGAAATLGVAEGPRLQSPAFSAARGELVGKSGESQTSSTATLLGPFLQRQQAETLNPPQSSLEGERRFRTLGEVGKALPTESAEASVDDGRVLRIREEEALAPPSAQTVGEQRLQERSPQTPLPRRTSSQASDGGAQRTTSLRHPQIKDGHSKEGLRDAGQRAPSPIEFCCYCTCRSCLDCACQCCRDVQTDRGFHRAHVQALSDADADADALRQGERKTPSAKTSSSESTRRRTADSERICLLMSQFADSLCAASVHSAEKAPAKQRASLKEAEVKHENVE